MQWSVNNIWMWLLHIQDNSSCGEGLLQYFVFLSGFVVELSGVKPNFLDENN